MEVDPGLGGWAVSQSAQIKQRWGKLFQVGFPAVCLLLTCTAGRYYAASPVLRLTEMHKLSPAVRL